MFAFQMTLLKCFVFEELAVGATTVIWACADEMRVNPRVRIKINQGR
jgi:hypothetical protein